MTMKRGRKYVITAEVEAISEDIEDVMLESYLQTRFASSSYIAINNIKIEEANMDDETFILMFNKEQANISKACIQVYESVIILYPHLKSLTIIVDEADTKSVSLYRGHEEHESMFKIGINTDNNVRRIKDNMCMGFSLLLYDYHYNNKLDDMPDIKEETINIFYKAIYNTVFKEDLNECVSL